MFITPTTIQTVRRFVSTKAASNLWPLLCARTCVVNRIWEDTETARSQSIIWSFLLILSSGPKQNHERPWRKFACCVSWRYDRPQLGSRSDTAVCYLSRLSSCDGTQSGRQFTECPLNGRTKIALPATYWLSGVSRVSELHSYRKTQAHMGGSRSKSLLKQSDGPVRVTVINETEHILPGDGLRAI